MGPARRKLHLDVGVQAPLHFWLGSEGSKRTSNGGHDVSGEFGVVGYVWLW